METPPPWRLLTLDTSCVSALANPQDSNELCEVDAVTRIVDSARDRRVRLQLTTAYDRDFERFTVAEGRASRLAWLAQAPALRRAPGVFRLDVSALDAGDVIGGDEDEELDQRLRDILMPSLGARPVPPYEEAPGAAAKRFSDLDHLIAHWRSGADAFVTLDTNTILNRTEALERLGIRACKPSQALPFLPDG